MKMRTRKCALVLLALVFCSLNPDTSLGSSCDCPSNDPLAKKACGPEPQKLNKYIISSEKFNECIHPLKALSKTSKLASQSIDLLTAPTGTKTQKELLDYISCYRPSDQIFCHYKTTLAPHIALAAESAGLPTAVQTCLFMREAGFQPNLDSPVGALGYVQFMPGMVTELKTIIFGSVDDWKKDIADAKAGLLKIAELLKNEKRDNKIAAYKKDKKYYEALIPTRIAKINAKRTWDAYWQGSKKVPTQLGNQDLQCPQVAFALSAVKQTYDLGLISRFKVVDTVKENQRHMMSINGMNERDSAILLAGGYNAGIGSIGRTCGRVKTLEECLKLYPENRETRRHMSSIRSCSKKNSIEPMAGNRQMDCEASKCGN